MTIYHRFKNILLSHQKNLSFELLLILLVITLLNVLWMPKEFNLGDSYAIKLSAINLVKTSTFGIRKEHGKELKDLLKIKGQYFHENQTDHKYYSRWGFFNTILSAIPEFFGSRTKTSEILITEKTILRHNIFNIFLSLGIGIFLFLIASKYSSSYLSKILFIFSTLYSTFIFHYLRAQSYEIVQLLFSLAFYYFFITYLDNKKSTSLWGWITSLWVLVLVKDFFFVLYFPVAIFLLEDNQYRMSKKILWSLLSFMVPLIIIFATNKMQFEEFVFLKKAAHAPYDQSIIPFSIANIPQRLIILFSFLGLRKTWALFRRDLLFVLLCFLTIFLPILCFYSIGEWCYGPRLIISVLTLMAFPSICFFDELQATSLLRVKNIIMVFLFSSIAGYSTYLQFHQNSRTFFLKYSLSSLFSTLHREEIDSYFEHVPSPLIAKEFNLFIKNGDYFYPFQEVIRGKTTENQNRLKKELYLYCKFRCQCNYYFDFNCNQNEFEN
jgi:hypothetical protein